MQPKETDLLDINVGQNKDTGEVIVYLSTKEGEADFKINLDFWEENRRKILEIIKTISNIKEGKHNIFPIVTIDTEISEKYAYVMQDIIDFAKESIDKLDISNSQKTFLYLCSIIEMFEDMISDWKKLKLLKDIITAKRMIKNCLLTKHFKQNEMQVVGLFGSAKFKEDFLEIEKKLSFKGFLVLLPYFDGLGKENKDKYSKEQWEYLMNQAYKRVEISDIIFIVNKNGYIGDHTRKEIDYAFSLHKEIEFMEDCIEELGKL